jgi:hypothetical protein
MDIIGRSYRTKGVKAMRIGNRVFVAVVVLSLGTLACGLGGAVGELQEVQEQVEAVQDQVDAVQAQDDGSGGGMGFGEECPLVTTAEVEAATGSSVVGSTTVDTSESMHCSFGLESESFFQIQVTDAGENVANVYQNLLNNAVGEGSEVDGPWEAGMFFPSSGLMFRTTTDVVWISMDNQNAAVQVGSAVAGRLP